MSLWKALLRSFRSRAVAGSLGVLAFAWAAPLSAGGIADWLNRRLAEQAKEFDDGDELAIEPLTRTRRFDADRSFLGLRGGSARPADGAAEARAAVGVELELGRERHDETEGRVAMLGQSDRVAFALWLGVPSEARLEAAIGPSFRWSEEGAGFVRVGTAAALLWETSNAVARFDLAGVDLGAAFDGAAFFEPSARSRARVTVRDAGGTSALLVGAGARLFVAPLLVDAEWLAPVTSSDDGAPPELAAALCSFLDGPVLCAALARVASARADEASVVRLELRLGWGEFARDRR